jgi:hypothetical protein
MALAAAAGQKRGMRGCSVGRAAEAARQQHSNGGQCGSGVGNARVAEAAQQRCWMRRWQVDGGGSRAAGRRQRRQQSGGSTATAAAERQRLWQHSGGCGSAQKRSGGGISAAEARSRQAVRQQRLQRGVSGSSTVASLAEWRRQRGSGAETAGSRWQ